jgi:hypothetical protein
MADENYDGEHTLSRGKDAFGKCQCLIGIDGLTNSKSLDSIKQLQ